MARMEMDCNLKKMGNVFKFVALCLEKLAKTLDYGSFSLRKFT